MYTWKTSKIKKLFSDLDADIKKKHVYGTKTKERTQVLKIEPYGGTDEIVLCGYKEGDKKLDGTSEGIVDYIEVRPEKDTEDINITLALIEWRFKKLNIPYKIEDKWESYSTYNYYNKNKK